MPPRLLSPCVPVSQWESRLSGTLRPRQGIKKLHILTHTAHAANQVGVELVLILVTGPHVASVCWPCLEGRCPKEPPARGLCTPCSSLKKAAKWTETGSQRAVQWRDSRSSEKWLHPPLPTDLLPPLEVREEAPPWGTSKLGPGLHAKGILFKSGTSSVLADQRQQARWALPSAEVQPH